MSIYDATPAGAWVWAGPGIPDNLHLEMLPLPVPAPGEVLVANRAIGLNPVDWKIAENGHEAWKPGHVPGVDGAGVVSAVGEGVRLPVGSRVAYHQALARDGSFARFTLVDARALLLVPDALDDLSAAALPCPALTAWQAVAKVAGGIGRDMLVTGAGGMVGLFAVQRGLERGWRVWATAAPHHHGLLKELGVADAFDYRDEGWTDRLRAALGPRQLHGIIDTVDSAKARAMASMLGYNGHLVYILYRQESLPMPIFTTALSVHEVALNAIHKHGTDADWREWRAMGAELFAKAATGQVRLPPMVLGDFNSLPKELAALKHGSTGGKHVIRVRPDSV